MQSSTQPQSLRHFSILLRMSIARFLFKVGFVGHVSVDLLSLFIQRPRKFAFRSNPASFKIESVYGYGEDHS